MEAWETFNAACLHAERENPQSIFCAVRTGLHNRGLMQYGDAVEKALTAVQAVLETKINADRLERLAHGIISTDEEV